DGRRLVVVADRPLFFLTADPSRNRAGYELTAVELHIDNSGGVTGRMSGAARVKPSPEGVVLSDFAEAPVQLTAHMSKPCGHRGSRRSDSGSRSARRPSRRCLCRSTA